MSKESLLDLEESQIEARLQSAGQPAYRGRQIFGWIHRKGAHGFSEMTDLPLSLRDQLGEQFDVRLPEIENTAKGKGAAKLLLRLSDGLAVECVRIESEGGFSACLSSQTGCRLGCRFCATARVGSVRNLSPGEMVAQFHALNTEKTPLRHVVFMGMGEPFLNYGNVMAAIRILESPHGVHLGARRFTISTAGLVPEIYRFAGERLQVNLAVSLNAPDQKTRESLMPIARYFPLDRLMKACHHYVRETHRRLSFEYVLFSGINDSPSQAEELARLVKGERFHVNLIPYNAIEKGPFQAVPASQVRGFQQRLIERGVAVTLRRSPGTEIGAACGQLAGCGFHR